MDAPSATTIIDTLHRIEYRFISGNSIPVERTHLTKAEWVIVEWALRESLKTD
jgi:hypothetical protein